MNKYFGSLKETWEKASNYKIDSETKKFSKKKLEHFFEADVETMANYQHIIDSILFAIRNKATTLEEIKKYIEDNYNYMIVYPRYEEFENEK